MNTINQSTIRRILLGNTISSGVSGLLFTLASAPIANFLGVGSPLFV